MSRAFTISLILVTLLTGGIAGFAVAEINPATVPESQERKLVDDTQGAVQSDSVSGLYTDQLFLKEMIAHHEAAVTMSKQVLAHTSRGEIRKMAGDIIETQTKEIEQMRLWLEEWK